MTPEKKVEPAPLVPPFVRYVASAIPMVFDDSLSYYECLAALTKYLQDVVKVINNNGAVTEEYIQLTKDMKEYMDNYFENLDVQEEINNKLDQMAEDGTLQEIITAYIQANVAWVFDTVADMKLATNLVAGSYAQTLGFRSINDGGGAIYKISDTGIANEMDVIAVGDLYANVCLSVKAIPEQFGAYGDGVHDDLTYLNRCESYCIEHSLIMSGNPSSVYGISDGFTISTGVNVDFNTATIKALTTMDYVVRQHRTTEVHTDPVLNEYTKNIVIDCDNKAEYGFYQDILGWSVLTDNIRVLNPKQIGIYIKVGQIRLMNSKVEQMDRTKYCIGLQVDSSDSEYTNIVTRECTTGIKVSGNGNTFSECHPVIFYNPIEGSAGFELSNRTELVNCMSDTFHYGIKITHNTGFRAINFRAIGETSYYNAQNVSTVPYFLYSTSTDVSYTYYITLVGCDMARSASWNDSEYMKFSNFDTWAGGSLRLANPNFMLSQFANEVAKEIRQNNSTYNIKTLIAENFTVDNAQILRNGNTFAIRLENITLPAITADTLTTVFSNIDSTHRVGTTIQEDVITENGVPCRLTIRTDGTIRIFPLGDITSGDHLYKYIYVLI